MKSRELIKSVLVTILVTNMLLTTVGCNEPTTPPEILPPEPTPVVYTTQEFKNSVGDAYRFKTLGTEEAYNEARKGLTVVEGKSLALSGHQIYLDEVTGTKYIISEICKTSLSEINPDNLYAEKTGDRVIFTTQNDLNQVKDTFINIRILNDVLNLDREEGINVEGRKINLVFNDKSYNIPNLIDETPDGKVGIAINHITKATGMEFVDKTNNKSGPQFYGIPTSMLKGINLCIEIPSTPNRYDLIFDEITGNVYYTCNANFVDGAYYVHEDYLKDMLGWEIKYLPKENLLVIRTDDMYEKGVLVNLPKDRKEMLVEVNTADLAITKTEYTSVDNFKPPVVDEEVAAPEDKPISDPQLPTDIVVDVGKPSTPPPPAESKPVEGEINTPEEIFRPEQPAPSTPSADLGKVPGGDRREMAKNMTEGMVIDRNGNILPAGSKVPKGGLIMTDGVVYINGPTGLTVVGTVSQETVEWGEPTGEKWGS